MSRLEARGLANRLRENENKPSRTVTRGKRRCVVCEKGFTATRKDARYCSGACRQKAARARVGQDDLAREIDEARAHYWALVRKYAEARGLNLSQVVTEQAQFVDADGNVRIGAMGNLGPVIGRTTPHRPGWAAWGLETAGPPFSPPTVWVDNNVRRAVDDHARVGGAS